jgi:hypothetical protein
MTTQSTRNMTPAQARKVFTQATRSMPPEMAKRIVTGAVRAAQRTQAWPGVAIIVSATFPSLSTSPSASTLILLCTGAKRLASPKLNCGSRALGKPARNA